MQGECQKTVLQDDEVRGVQNRSGNEKSKPCEALTHREGDGSDLSPVVFPCHFFRACRCDTATEAREVGGDLVTTHWQRVVALWDTKKRTVTVKKSSHELRKMSSKWGTHRVMWYCGGRECLLAQSKKSGLQREGRGSGL
jgi:hypothetical protein